jgi:putative ABC transport system permease protein
MWHDLKTACRELLKNRWFTCVTVLTLALGIGANTAIFGVVNKLLLSPWPYPHGDRLVSLQLATQRIPFGFPMFGYVVAKWRDEAQSLDGVAAYELQSMLAYDERGARVVSGMRITSDLPAVLGVSPLLGRSFMPDDAIPGAPAVVLLGYEAWQRDYGGDRDIVGRAITLDNAPHVVIGIMPARSDAFASPSRADVWFPLVLRPAPASPSDMQLVSAFARLRADVPVETVNGEIDALFKRAAAESPVRPFGPDTRALVMRPGDRVSASARDALLVLVGAVALVLLVACSNVANLLLARSTSRARELALRTALGASAWRLIRALLAECLVLALAAGVVGVFFGWLTLRVVVRLRPGSMAALGDLQLDPTVLAFTFGLSIVTAILFGTAPALQFLSPKFGDALRHGASGVVRAGGGARVRKFLVAAQMALSVILLVSAGLLVRTFIHLQDFDVGFDTKNLFTANLALPRGRYQTPASRDALAEQLFARVGNVPGVAAVTQAFMTPPNSMSMSGFGLEIPGVTLSEADKQEALAFNFVGPTYFNTLGIRMREGRTFTDDEVRSGAAVVINRAAAQRFWPEGNAIGAQLKRRNNWETVVGVVDDVAASGPMGRPEGPRFYAPYQSERVPGGASAPTATGAPPNLSLIIRAAGDPSNAITALRAATSALDPEIAIPSVNMVETLLANTIAAPRFNMVLLTAFAVIGLVLAAVGLAAVIGHEVAERTHEFGIRMALGARTENVRRLAMRHGLTPAFVGVVIGVAGALAATQLATSLLHGVTPRDPLTFVGVIALLVLVAFAASWLPARRATRVDPIIALRAE